MRNSYSRTPIALAAAGLLLSLAPTTAFAAESEDITALREQIRLLDQKLRVLERKQEIKDEESATAAKAAAKVTVNDRGFTLASADAANSLRIRGLIQGDSRWFLNSDLNNNDAFILRRARLSSEGVFNKIYSWQLVSEFGGGAGNGTLNVIDANVNIAFKPQFQVRVGRFREPVGLEQLQSDAVANFTERSVVSQFAPNRDLGALINGDVLNGTVNYGVGIFNGVADGQNNTNNGENNNKKDFAARLFAQPFKNDKDSVLQGLGLGIGGNLGNQNGTAGGLTPGYRSDGQQTWFAYRATTVAKGKTYRYSPQGYFYRGPFGVLGEYIVSSVEARNGATLRTVNNKAWQLSSNYVLTGENAGYTGVQPKTNFDPANGTWGAFEIVARVANADIDDDVFTGGANSLAAPATAATEATSYGIGVNWYPAKAVRFSLNYFHTEFDAVPGVVPATTTVIGQDENAIFTRLQVVF